MDAERFLNVGRFDDEMNDGQLGRQVQVIGLRQFYLTGLSQQSLELGYPGECRVCFERRLVVRRPCCNLEVCKNCLKSYYTSLVSDAIVKIQCIGYSCNEYVTRDEIVLHLDEQTRRHFRHFLVDANKDPNQKTCPRCNLITDLDQKAQIDAGDKKSGIRVMCPECNLVWCFRCHGPWHEALSCKEYKRGDALFKSWTKQRQNEQLNAQKCPKCKIYIQRSSGCDHMTCNRCSTNFCYQCGEKYRSLKFLGSHDSRFSIFGCKYRFKPENPVKRRLIRGSIFGGTLLAAPVIGGLALGAGAVVLGVGLMALPFYGGYRLHKLLRRRRREKNLESILQLWTVPVGTDHRDLWEEETARSRRDETLPAVESSFNDSILDMNLSDIVEDTDVEIDGFQWELSSAEYRLVYGDVESRDRECDEDDCESHLDVSCCDEEGLHHGKSSLDSLDVDNRGCCALNSKFDSCIDAFNLNNSFGLKNSNPDDKSDVRLSLKPSKVETAEIEPSGSVMEARSETDMNLPKMERGEVPALIRRHCIRSLSHFDSERLAKALSIVRKTCRKSNRNELTTTDKAAPRNEEYISPCDMVTHM